MDQKHILIVDDALYSRVTLSNFLKNHGFTVSFAVNGEEAIKFISSSAVDLIIMDIVMPIMDGLTAIRHIKQDPARANIPIIIVSAHAKNDQIDAALKSGVDAYIKKPASNELVLFKIQEILNISKNRSKTAVNPNLLNFVKLFDDENIINRYRAVDSLVKLGELISPDLQKLVINGTRNQRYFSLLTLGKIKDVNAIGIIAQALKDEDPFIRRLAAEMLGTLQAQKGLDALIEGTSRQEEESWVRQAINWAIDRINS